MSLLSDVGVKVYFYENLYYLLQRTSQKKQIKTSKPLSTKSKTKLKCRTLNQ